LLWAGSLVWRLVRGDDPVTAMGVILDRMERIHSSLGGLPGSGRCGGLKQEIFNTEEARGPRRRNLALRAVLVVAGGVVYP
jgi:hypothetical protein